MKKIRLQMVTGAEQKNEECPRPKVANLTRIAENDGFVLETHKVKTSDGFSLTMHFLPQTKISRFKSPTVFLQHGILSSANFWFMNSANENLAYFLHKKGFNVMLANFRGTTHSMSHESLDPSSTAFWDFSFHEHGKIDLAERIDLSLTLTNQKSLSVIGLSMGTTATFVLLSESPEYNDKISKVVAMAPVAFLSHVTDPVISTSSRLLQFSSLGAEFSFGVLGLNTFSLENLPFVSYFLDTCANERSEKRKSLQTGKSDILSRNSGVTPKFQSKIKVNVRKFNNWRNLLIFPVVNRPRWKNGPDGKIDFLLDFPSEVASLKTLIHYGQNINSGRFAQYDGGWAKNLWNYKSSSPPDYPLNKITTSVLLLSSPSDGISRPEDVEKLKTKLISAKELTAHSLKNVESHVDFAMARDCDKHVFCFITEFLTK